MYIALISLHALIMVGFHFLHCFEEDWTSEYVPDRAPLAAPGGGVQPRRGGLLVWVMVPGANPVLLDLLQAYRLTREGTAEARISLHDKKQPPKVSSTGKGVSQTDPVARACPGEVQAPQESHPRAREPCQGQTCVSGSLRRGTSGTPGWLSH